GAGEAGAVVAVLALPVASTAALAEPELAHQLSALAAELVLGRQSSAGDALLLELAHASAGDPQQIDRAGRDDQPSLARAALSQTVQGVDELGAARVGFAGHLREGSPHGVGGHPPASPPVA